jgi:hypothetical protein
MPPLDWRTVHNAVRIRGQPGLECPQGHCCRAIASQVASTPSFLAHRAR